MRPFSHNGPAMKTQAPTHIKLHKKSKMLEIQFASETFELPAEFLRVYSPSAEVKGHGNPILQIGKLHVSMTGIEMVGQYAIKIVFDDGHNSGIYDWSYLYELCTQQKTMWQQYLQALHEAGKSRDPETSVVKMLL